jgi:ribosome maturation factor RimP
VKWAIGPFFVFGDEVMRRNIQHLYELLDPIVTAMDYELVGVECHGVPNNILLRVYIDRESGIGLDDCQLVSRQISGLLDVEDPIAGSYTLEVSSPGLDRLLFEAKHYERFEGQQARIILSTPLTNNILRGKRKFTGLLKGIRGTDVVVEIDGVEQLIPLEMIESARLVPEI